MSLKNSVIYGVSHQLGRFQHNYTFSIHFKGRSFWFTSSHLNNYINYLNKPNTFFIPPNGNVNQYDLGNETIISYDRNNHFKIIYEYSANVIRNDYTYYNNYSQYYGFTSGGGTQNINGETQIINSGYYFKYWRVQKVNFSSPTSRAI